MKYQRSVVMTTAQKPYVDNADVYINFQTGRLSLTEVQQIFTTIPFELDLIDHTDHFAWFSNKPNREHVRSVDQVGETVQQCHPARVLPHVMGIINAFKAGTKDVVRVPLYMHGHRVLIQYYALRDVDGTYLGTIEFTGSVEDILGFYEKGAWGANAPGAAGAGAAAGGASVSADATSGASESPAVAAPVAGVIGTPGAPVIPDAAVIPDATSGASDTDYPSAEESAAATGAATPAAPAAAPVVPPSAFAAPTSSDADAAPDATSGASETPGAESTVEPVASAAPATPDVPVIPDAPVTPDATSGASATGM
jgi:hypothetical protein